MHVVVKLVVYTLSHSEKDKIGTISRREMKMPTTFQTIRCEFVPNQSNVRYSCIGYITCPLKSE